MYTVLVQGNSILYPEYFRQKLKQSLVTNELFLSLGRIVLTDKKDNLKPFQNIPCFEIIEDADKLLLIKINTVLHDACKYMIIIGTQHVD